jgi:DNA-binding MarR family transcriptional regulator
MTEQNQSETTTSPKKPRQSSNADKWGAKVMEQGFCMIPSLLLRAQRRLHLNPSQLAVLLQIIDHWWDAARKPYPSKRELSCRLGISERQVQRYITDLEKEGLLRRQERYGEHGGRQTNIYDLQGLVDKLAEIEPEFREAREQAQKIRKAAASPGWRPQKKTRADKVGSS